MSTIKKKIQPKNIATAKLVCELNRAKFRDRNVMF
jgi:hypothetical protein